MITKDFSHFSIEERKIRVLSFLSQQQNRLKADKTLKGKDRQRQRYGYYLQGYEEVCKSAFFCVCGLGTKAGKALLNYYKMHRSTNPPGHKLLGQINNIEKDLSKRQDQVNLFDSMFNKLKAQAEESRAAYVLINEGKNRQVRKSIFWLTADNTRDALYHKDFLNALQQNLPQNLDPQATKSLSFSTFCRLWDTRYPEIKIRKPRSDTCDECTELYIQLASTRQTNPARAEFRLQIERELQTHKQNAEAMRQQLTDDKARYEKFLSNMTDNNNNGRIILLCFDFAQNLWIPHSKDSTQSSYFLSLHNFYLMGFADTQSQYNYIYSEGEGGKGSDYVTSILLQELIRLQCFTLDEFFEGKPSGSYPSNTTLILWSDNCGGQNKNATVMGFCDYLVYCGFFKCIEYRFLVRGHTFFPPDSGFALIKKKFVKTDSYCPEDLLSCVKSSCKNDGTILTSANFFQFSESFKAKFRKIPNISKFHYFTFRGEEKGKVEVKEYASSRAETVNMAKDGATIPGLNKINYTAPGLGIIKLNDHLKKVLAFVHPRYWDSIRPIANNSLADPHPNLPHNYLHTRSTPPVSDRRSSFSSSSVAVSFPTPFYLPSTTLSSLPASFSSSSSLTSSSSTSSSASSSSSVAAASFPTPFYSSSTSLSFFPSSSSSSISSFFHTPSSFAASSSSSQTNGVDPQFTHCSSERTSYSPTRKYNRHHD